MILSMLRELIKCSQFVIENTFYPVPEYPIVVGSTFQGWGPPEEEPIFRLLVPFRAPRGHIFRLDLGTTQELPVKNSCIHVEWECTCGREQEMGMLCFLHTSEDELRNQSPSLLDTLCTGPYLDVRKTACWFKALCITSWKYLTESSVCSLNVMLLLKRSCRLRLTDAFKRTFLIEIMFGVQQDNTDIFLSSQETEAAYTPSTTWPQTCAVAEAKFFKHISARAEEDNFYLGYMQVCAYILVGYNFSPYELKTVLMHLLTATPIESWSRRYFVQRMDDIFRYLRCSLEEKRLDHFLIGNEAVPAEIILPQEFRVSRPPNLFQHLAQDPDKHEQALYELEMLEDR
ncbi:IPIL1 protein, partial [Odontophorus gujanensis]|nr:IPIL1 protein [Odontophorus gujanensis]